ncbi:MAG: SAM hydrolase/SAM-dependent halogenase family protein [Burkholderiales bacterium]
MPAAAPIFLYTDFGSADIYVGQVKGVLHGAAPDSPVIDLLNDARCFEVTASAHLLAALAPQLPLGAVVMAVVDPGVGGTRDAIVLEADGRWFVAPDNGLVSVVAARAGQKRCCSIGRIPKTVSVSFHGRDLFAPAAARIARGEVDWLSRPVKAELDVRLGAEDLLQIIYSDHYGNAITGIRADTVDPVCRVTLGARALEKARVFSDVPTGSAFWYENSIGLVEIAANGASAAVLLNLSVGQSVGLQPSARV